MYFFITFLHYYNFIKIKIRKLYMDIYLGRFFQLLSKLLNLVLGNWIHQIVLCFEFWYIKFVIYVVNNLSIILLYSHIFEILIKKIHVNTITNFQILNIRHNNLVKIMHDASGRVVVTNKTNAKIKILTWQFWRQ